MLDLSSARSGEAAGPVDPTLFREGMSLVTSAVHIVTVRTADRTAGVTATAMCALSDRPSSLLVCLHRQGRVGSMLRAGLPMAINTLGGGHDAVADVFAGRGRLQMAERFGHGEWRDDGVRAPFLADSLATFFCRISDVVPAATHLVVVGRVTDLKINAAPRALIYGARRYRSLDLAAGWCAEGETDSPMQPEAQ